MKTYLYKFTSGEEKSMRLTFLISFNSPTGAFFVSLSLNPVPNAGHFYKNRTKAHESLCGKPGFGQKPLLWGRAAHSTPQLHLTRGLVSQRSDLVTTKRRFSFTRRRFENLKRRLVFSYGLQKRVPTKARNTSLGIFVFLYYQTMKLCIFILHGQIIKDF